MKNRASFLSALLLAVIAAAATPSIALSQSTPLILGYSGSGISTDLRRVMDLEKIWEKHGLNVKSVYFNSGSVLTQAMAGGNIVVSDSGVPEMLVLPVSGIFDSKVITVNINRLEHIFVVRKNVAKPEDLKSKRIAVSRFGSASDLTTRMVLRSWKLNPEKDVVLLQSGNTPTRMTALIAGHVDGALVSPESLHKVLASGCCRSLADLSELPLDFARFGVTVPGSLIRNQRDTVRRIVMAYVEGIHAFKTKPNLVYAVLEEEGIKDPAIAKDIYNRLSFSMREYPIPEAAGIQTAIESLGHPNARSIKPAAVMDTTVIEEVKKSGFIDKLYGRAPKNER
ncbi:MAG TPA: ABC transporter substrate-binding protein [Candidatus Binatia bacterium]|nr:ABC transporter substrate-binding protein [Candidatus Binatia bacterium]